jgi:hypothetical protein
MLFLSGITSFAVSKTPKRQKSRVERNGSNTSERSKEAREKRESRKEAVARRAAIRGHRRVTRSLSSAAPMA